MRRSSASAFSFLMNDAVAMTRSATCDVAQARVRAFLAASLDGFIAGENDDLSWLPPADPSGEDHGFGAFLAQVGALLLGRRTYDVVAGFDGPWPYGDRPVLVATHRELQSSVATLRPVQGAIAELVHEAREAAAGLDVYADGGDVLRQVLDAGLLDEVVVTVIPVILGRGVPLFAGVRARHTLELVRSVTLPRGMMQLTYRPSQGRI